ncbi:hypothetical protein [Treponema denticola]|uniref:Uncharacterized protein n=1 Tax=Treponema denticola SP33 TaxID=999437 RepID=M2BD51_TREDN|nr:hypothetical protein [Treponema denticola]EMB19563.1 hypothetical protein HMPREF9733_02663 [Treponema denticola SP33]
MEFDKSKVYTAVNADELQIGSRCIFADTVRGLRRKVEEDTDCVETFYRLHNDGGDDLFVGNDCAYCYAYLIEPPAEPKYKPFSNIDKAMEAIKKHGGWLKRKAGQTTMLVVGFDCDGCLLGNANYYSIRALFSDFVFADDETPCGELVEE